MLERWWRPLLALCAALHVSTLFGELPEPDAALYASIARRIATSGDWVNLLAYNVDWLDKPHFPFWVTALSFKAFGVNVVSARLPALLFFALGVWATWQLAHELFSRSVAQASVLILLTSQHVVMSNADTRAEPFLIGLLTPAVWLTIRVVRAKDAWGRDLALASLCTAAAMMTKGPFVLIPVGAVAVVPSILRREPLRWSRWLTALALVALFITPELACLYLQFDAHPEKTVFETTGVSGVTWFLWQSQLGRFANTGPIRGKGDPTFFFHTVLWSFLPWGLLLYATAVSRLRQWKLRSEDAYLWAATVPLVLVFSASRFQLPHYVNILFPFFAVLIARWLESAPPRAVSWTQSVVLVGMTGFLGWLLLTFEVPLAWILVGTMAVTMSLVLFVREPLLRSAAGALIINVFHQHVFVRESLKYQVGGEAAEVAKALPPMRTVMLDLSSHAFAFHLHETARWWTDADLLHELPNGPVRVLTRAEHLAALGLPFTERARFQYFRASMPTGAFLDAKRRPSVLDTWVLAEVTAPQP